MGDLAFANEQAERKVVHEHMSLEEEYFSRIEDLRPEFAELDMELSAGQFTPVTWILWAAKSGRAEGGLRDDQATLA